MFLLHYCNEIQGRFFILFDISEKIMIIVWQQKFCKKKKETV